LSQSFIGFLSWQTLRKPGRRGRIRQQSGTDYCHGREHCGDHGAQVRQKSRLNPKEEEKLLEKLMKKLMKKIFQEALASVKTKNSGQRYAFKAKLLSKSGGGLSAGAG
jgi:hypothetical protein